MTEQVQPPQVLQTAAGSPPLVSPAILRVKMQTLMMGAQGSGETVIPIPDNPTRVQPKSPVKACILQLGSGSPAVGNTRLSCRQQVPGEPWCHPCKLTARRWRMTRPLRPRARGRPVHKARQSRMHKTASGADPTLPSGANRWHPCLLQAAQQSSLTHVPSSNS